MTVSLRWLTAVALLVAVPAMAQGADSSGTLRGRITAPSDVWIVGLTVTLDSARHVDTDSAGRFAFRDIAAGPHGITVSRGGRAIAQRAVTVIAGRATDLLVELGARTTASTTQTLPTVTVTAARALHVIGHEPDVRDGVIYAGKKTEVIVVDSLHGNAAQDIERQILGRIPGAHFSETAAAGFPSNGVGFRGLDPTQSVEMNTRQNGINIAADVYGYPETYYTPPTQALERIEVVRGAGSLAYGPQFGGAINYVVRRGTPNSAPALTSEQSAGSYGLFNSFNAVGGGTGPWTYYAFAHYRGESGWRPNSAFRQVAAYGSASYRASDRLALGVELTVFRNRIHMPGGLSDSAFAADPRQSLRARNWLTSPWNIASLRASYELSPTAHLETTLSGMASERSLVWRNEDGGPAAPDSIDPATGTFVPREVEKETFRNATLESRLSVEHHLRGRTATLSTGVRLLAGTLHRYEGGPGSTGSDFDLHLYGGAWERALAFETRSAAAYAEELVHVTDRLAVTPGVRYEFVRSTASGYTDVDSSFAPRTVSRPLAGLGAEYAASSSTMLYANVTQAYRPILYESLAPFGSIARVAPVLRAAHGYNADLGWRGTVGAVLKFDVGAFYLAYRDRIGTRTVIDGADTVLETANVGDSRHLGLETYVELDPLPLVGVSPRFGTLDLFTSFAWIDARYVSGEFRGNRVEQAPRIVDRTGITYGLGGFATTVQASYTARSYGDANNSVPPTSDGAAGLVPAYTVLDWSARVRLGRYVVRGGINNLANRRYFTKRTAEYPGPGILPGIGRSGYAGLSVAF